MSVIYLVRHGQASYLQENYDQLSELGFKQSTILGEAMQSRNLSFSRQVSGTLHRHFQTAERCLKVLEARTSLEQDPRWNEYDHMELLQKHNSNFSSFEAVGSFIREQSDSLKALQQILNNSLVDWMDDRHNYFQSWVEFKQGVVAALTDLAGQLSQDEKAVVFSSGGPISAVLIHLLELKDDKFIDLQGRLINTSITKVIVGKRGLSLGSYNEYSHLEHDPNLITFR